MPKEVGKMLRIGVLSLQGAVIEHLRMLNSMEGVEAASVKTAPEISEADALILPGGESTTMGKLLNDFDLTGLLSQRIADGMPVWGTCAGMILLAKKICGQKTAYLQSMDIEVCRNAYGSQLDSFCVNHNIPQISQSDLPLVFIRAPYVKRVWNDVEVLAVVEGKIIACRQKNILATSFHPELTSDLSFHKYFAKMSRAVMEKSTKNCLVV